MAAIAGGVLAGALSLSSCGQGAVSSSGPILRSSPATHTVKLRLVAAQTGANSGFNFDGYGSGAMTVLVPRGWTVIVTCSNASSTFTHSCAIVRNTPPGLGGAPLAFPGAESASPRSGLQDGQSSQFRFVAGRVGRYRIACLVPAHEVDGMWDVFVVTAGGRPAVHLGHR